MIALDAYQGISSNLEVAHSLGAKRMTPAATDASISVFCAVPSISLKASMNERTVCTPSRARVSLHDRGVSSCLIEVHTEMSIETRHQYLG
jgi:hypothetical protein